MTELESFRAEKNRFFATHSQSPLMPEQKRSFKGLNYFRENPALRLVVAVKKFPQQAAIQMQTTTEGIQTYTRFGKFKFTVEGQEAELTLYAAPYGGYFLPLAGCRSEKNHPNSKPSFAHKWGATLRFRREN